jgi:hypothetical protein
MNHSGLRNTHKRKKGRKERDGNEKRIWEREVRRRKKRRERENV